MTMTWKGRFNKSTETDLFYAVVYRIYNSTEYGWRIDDKRESWENGLHAFGRCDTEQEAMAEAEKCLTEGEA